MCAEDENDEEDEEGYASEQAVKQDVCKRKRKRIRNRKRNLPLRVLKNDIRRYYAQMYVNVLNSYDDEKIISFFETYACSEVRFDKHCTLVSPLYSSEYINVKGIPQLALFWMAALKLVPDHVCSVEDIRIITSSGSDECCIVCTLHANFTNCCMASAPTVAMHIVNSYDWDNNQEDIKPGIRSSMGGRRFVDMSRVSNVIPHGALERCDPWTMLATSKLTIFIDSRKNITRFNYTLPAFAF